MQSIKLTGDPFVDLGGLVMDALPHTSIEDKVRFATDVYVDRWKGKINAVFLHSKITHISVSNKPKLQKERSLEYYHGMLHEDGGGLQGYCRICGHSGALFLAGRENYPLVGSGEFVNFHHYHESGLSVCKDCLIKLFFVPLGILQSGDTLAFLQIQDEYTAQFWQEFTILDNLDRIHRGSSQGILKSSFLNPQNTLFHFGSRLIERFEMLELPPQQLRLFRFNNFGSKPDVQIYDLPNNVFSFLKRVLKPDLKADWTFFVKRSYVFGNAVRYDDTAGEWFEAKKNGNVKLDEHDYAGARYNLVYGYLLSGKSILRLLCRVHKVRSFPILIAIHYLKEVRRMRQEQIDLIRNISDRILALGQHDGDFKKVITPIEGARYAYQLRTAILRMAKAHYKKGEPDPFVRLQDYVDYLFPDGQSWYEVRDLMLICLYEKLHELRIAPAEVSDEEIPEIEDGEQVSLNALNQA